MNKIKKTVSLLSLALVVFSCTANLPNAKIDANVDQSSQKGTSSNSSDGKSGSGNGTPQQIVVNVNNNPNINTNINPNISNSSTTNNANSQNDTQPSSNSSSVNSSNTSSTGSGTSQPKYKILFVVRDSLSKNPIFSANMDGSLKTRLVQGESNQNNSFPVSSPDGKKVAFNSLYSIYVMNSDGTSNIPIVKGEFYSDKGTPSWTLDGKKIYYNSLQDGIFSINADGTQNTKIYKPETLSYFTRISPDSNTLAYISDSGSGSTLTTVGINGVGETQITDNSKILINRNSNICWTLDGKSILFSGYLPEEQNKYIDMNTDIYQINIDGTGLKKLTDNLGRDDYPSLSSDGKYIVFESKRDEGEGIYTMTSDGKNQQISIKDQSAEHPSFIATGNQKNVTSVQTSSPTTSTKPVSTNPTYSSSATPISTPTPYISPSPSFTPISTPIPSASPSYSP